MSFPAFDRTSRRALAGVVVEVDSRIIQKPGEPSPNPASVRERVTEAGRAVASRGISLDVLVEWRHRVVVRLSPVPVRTTAALVAVACFTALPARADEPAPADAGAELEAQRERFRVGLERYRAGAFAEAIVVWDTVYRELGPSRGYRLAFDLARAYEKFGDLTRAAECYEASLPNRNVGVLRVSRPTRP